MVKHIAIPQYEGLTIADMLGFLEKWPRVFDYLPIEKEIHKLPRQYLANVIITIVKAPFQEWVDQQIGVKNDKIK